MFLLKLIPILLGFFQVISYGQGKVFQICMYIYMLEILTIILFLSKFLLKKLFLDCVDHNIRCNSHLNCQLGFFQKHCPMSCDLCTTMKLPNERAINENPSVCIPVSAIPIQPTNTAEIIREAGFEMRSMLDEIKTVILAQFHEKCLNLHVNPNSFLREVMRMIMPNNKDEDEERRNNVALEIVSLDDFKTELIGLRELYHGNRFNESTVLEVLLDLRSITDNLVVLLETFTPATDCDLYTMLLSEIDDFRKRIPDNPCNGISGCCTQEHQCGEGEGICEATNNSTGCMSGFECATCVCPPNDNICPDGQSEFDCCTSEST